MRVIVVDDEPVARQYLIDLLAAHRTVQVVAQAGDGASALQVVAAESPEVLFLDIAMPGIGGLEVARQVLGFPAPPAIVFVTAHDDFAVSAFEVNAADYLLKPFDEVRLAQALHRLEQRLAAGDLANTRALLDQLTSRAQPGFLVAHDRGTASLINLEDVEWCRAEGNYVRVFARGQAHLVRESLTGLESRLAPLGLVRIHRSAIVRLAAIRSLTPTGQGDHLVLLHDGEEFTLSRRFKAEFDRRVRGGA